MKLYHGTSDKTIKEIHDVYNGWKGGMFFSDDRDNARSRGTNIFSVEIDEDDCIDSRALLYECGVDEFVLSHYKFNEQIDDEKFINTVARQNFDSNDFEGLAAVINSTSDTPFVTEEFELSFALQYAAAIIAKAIGYSAVGVDDEFGTSFIVFADDKITICKE